MACGAVNPGSNPGRDTKKHRTKKTINKHNPKNKENKKTKHRQQPKTYLNTQTPCLHKVFNLKEISSLWPWETPTDRDLTEGGHLGFCFILHAAIAQLVERHAVNVVVTGSSPVGGA